MWVFYNLKKCRSWHVLEAEQPIQSMTNFCVNTVVKVSTQYRC